LYKISLWFFKNISNSLSLCQDFLHLMLF
jgi:hypothetical protein